MDSLKEEINEKRADKLTDRVFTQSLVMSVFGILLCIVALCSATYAWFSADVSSPSNNIKSSSCDISVSVTNGGNTVDPQNGEYLLEAGKTYEFNISATGTAKSVYCILSIDGKDFYTEQIDVTPDGVAAASPQSGFTFSLMFSEDTAVTVVTRWGRSSRDVREIADGVNYIDPGKAVSSAPESSESETNGQPPESAPETEA